jgi:GNAT superfamily N-acetyltransferase
VILKNLDAAQNSVSIAVAWFTDVLLFNKLLEIQNRGIKIELIITKHQFNDDSLNDYELISQNNGVFLEIGGNYNTMHHKFCIVDHKILLQGSFNWTKKANESNNETLLVIKEDYQAIHEFNEEFERLKRLAGMDKELKELEIAKALKYFTLIRTFIDLGKPNDIYPYLQEIRDVSELSEIVNLLTSGQYDVAFLKMDELQRNFTAVVNVSHFEKEELIGAMALNHTGMSGYIPEHILVYFAIRKNRRGEGLGKMMMTQLLAQTRGSIALHVEPNNPAMRLYEEFGFTNKYMEMRLVRD